MRYTTCPSQTLRVKHVLLRRLQACKAAAAPPAQACAAGDPASAEAPEYFSGIGRIRYEGPDSKNIMAYKWYNASEEVAGRPMAEW